MNHMTMVERVARAIEEEGPVGGRISQEKALDIARAAIKAMRDPTDLMGNGLPEAYRPGSHSAREIWQAMIDAALSEVEG